MPWQVGGPVSVERSMSLFNLTKCAGNRVDSQTPVPSSRFQIDTGGYLKRWPPRQARCVTLSWRYSADQVAAFCCSSSAGMKVCTGAVTALIWLCTWGSRPSASRCPYWRRALVLVDTALFLWQPVPLAWLSSICSPCRG